MTVMNALQVNQTIGKTLWDRSGDQDNVWRHAHTTIPTSPLGDFYISFVATVGTGYQGDIAIDDLTLEDGM